MLLHPHMFRATMADAEVPFLKMRLSNNDGHDEVMLYSSPRKRNVLKWWSPSCEVMSQGETDGQVGGVCDAYMKVFQCCRDDLTEVPPLGPNEMQRTYALHEQWPQPHGWAKAHHVKKLPQQWPHAEEDQIPALEDSPSLKKHKIIKKGSGMAGQRVAD